MEWNYPMPPWIDHAFRHVGLREIPGKRDNPIIVKWLKELKAWWAEDDTPWCGTFIAHCLKESGLTVPKHWYRAKAYASYGTPVVKVAASIPLGSIAVKSRRGGGHVFFPVARSQDGKTIYGLGGNQSNMVNIVAFPLSVIDDVRWPPYSMNPPTLLPIATAAEIGAYNAGSEA